MILLNQRKEMPGPESGRFLRRTAFYKVPEQTVNENKLCEPAVALRHSMMERAGRRAGDSDGDLCGRHRGCGKGSSRVFLRAESIILSLFSTKRLQLSESSIILGIINH